MLYPEQRSALKLVGMNAGEETVRAGEFTGNAGEPPAASKAAVPCGETWDAGATERRSAFPPRQSQPTTQGSPTRTSWRHGRPLSGKFPPRLPSNAEPTGTASTGIGRTFPPFASGATPPRKKVAGPAGEANPRPKQARSFGQNTGVLSFPPPVCPGFGSTHLFEPL